jgi:spore coat protein CotH
VEAVEEGFLSRNHLTGPARKLYKPRSTDVSADALLQYIDDDPASYPNIFDSAKTEITEEDKARLIGILKNLREGTDIESAVDTEEVIRYFAVHSFLVNVYSYTGPKVRNYYLYEDSGMLRMIPWNYNLACMELKTDLSEAATVSASVNYAIDTPVTGPGILARPILAWIFSDETYTVRYHEVYREFMESVYDSGWLQEEIGTVAEMISSYLENDPTAFYSYEEFQKGVETLKEFFSLRCQSVKGQLDGAIPSTAEGQKQNRSALVDASSIDLKYLGRPQDKDKGSDDGSSASDQTGTGSEMTEEDDAQALTWFGISAAVLAVALIFAMRKRICR